MYVQLGIYTRQDIYASLEALAKQMQHFNATYRKIVGPAFAIPGQTITTFQCNKLQHCWRNMLRTFGHPVATCCDMLRHVGCCWLKFGNGQIFHATFVDFAWCCSRLARFVQKFCARACSLVRFSIPNMLQNITKCPPNVRNMLCPTMLQYVVFKCCDRLAGA